MNGRCYELAQQTSYSGLVCFENFLIDEQLWQDWCGFNNRQLRDKYSVERWDVYPPGEDGYDKDDDSDNDEDKPTSDKPTPDEPSPDEPTTDEPDQTK